MPRIEQIYFPFSDLHRSPGYKFRVGLLFEIGQYTDSPALPPCLRAPHSPSWLLDRLHSPAPPCCPREARMSEERKRSRRRLQVPTPLGWPQQRVHRLSATNRIGRCSSVCALLLGTLGKRKILVALASLANLENEALGRQTIPRLDKCEPSYARGQRFHPKGIAYPGASIIRSKKLKSNRGQYFYRRKNCGRHLVFIRRKSKIERIPGGTWINPKK